MNIIDPFDSNIHLLKKVLDLRETNQNVIASNIANADTPGYNRQEFRFEGELRDAMHTHSAHTMATTDSRHISTINGDINDVTGNIVEFEDQTGIGDKNGVSVDMEMMSLSENQLLYETTVQLLKKKLGLLEYAIKEGK